MKSWRALLGIVISAGFLFWAFRGQDYGRIREALRTFNYWYLIPALVVYMCGIWMRSYRWSVLLRPLARLKTRQVFPVNVVGFMANNVLPLRTGEVVRAYVLNKTHGVSKTSGLATIAVERLFDGLTMLSFMLVAKTMILIAAVFVSIAVLRLDPVPFALGFSVFVVSILMLGLRAAAAEREAS